MDNTLNDLGFVVLCPERNYGGLKSTANSIRWDYPGSTALCVVGEDATDEEVQEFNRDLRTVRAGSTITSLINRGMRESQAGWNFIVTAGSRLRCGAMRKFFFFAKDERCILYPVVDRKWAFDEATINGILIHKNAFDDIGPFAEKETNLGLVKLFWCLDAIEKGYQFRAIVGGRLV